MILKDLLNAFKQDIEKESLFPEIILQIKDIVSQKDSTDSFLEEKQKKIEKIILKEFFHIIKYGINLSRISNPKIVCTNKKESFTFEDLFETNKKYLKLYTDFSFMLEKLIHDNKSNNLNLFILHDLLYIKLKYKHFFPYILLKFLSDEFYSFLSFNEKHEKDLDEVKLNFNKLHIDYNKAFANLLFLLRYNLYFLISTGVNKKINSNYLENILSSYNKIAKRKKLSKKDNNTLAFWTHLCPGLDIFEKNKSNETPKIFNEIFNQWKNFHETNEDLIEILNLIFFSAEKTGFIEILKEKTVLKKDKSQTVDKQYILIGQELLQNIEISSIYKKIQLPFVCKPKNYEIKNDEKTSYIVGGFYTEQMSFDFPYRDKNKISLYSLNSEVLFDEVNYLQSLPWGINKEALENLLNLSIEDHILVEELELNFKDYINYDFLNKKKYKQQQMHNFVKVKQFLLSLYIIDIFKDLENIYFAVRGDSRSRLYLSGNPFNFQGIKLLRNLILSKKKNYKIESNFLTQKEWTKIYNGLDVLSRKLFSSCIKHRTGALLPNDATASIFQIIGGLIGSEKLLLLTNVLVDKENQESKDIYDFILQKVLFNTSFLNEINEKYIEFHKKCLNKNLSDTAYKQMLGSSFLDSPDVFISKFKEFCLTRKEIKKQVMPFAYNKSTKEMIKTFLSNNYISKFLFIKDDDKKTFWLIGEIFIKKLLKVIKEEFKELFVLKKLFIKIVNLCLLLKQSIPISFFNHFPGVNTGNRKVFSTSGKRLEEIAKTGFLQHYLKKEIIRIRMNKKKYELDSKSIIIKMTSNFTRVKGVDSGDYELDLNKNFLALLPNVCQHLDALILYSVISFSKSKDISLLPIHDSFYTEKKNYSFIRLAYFCSYLEYIHENSLKNMLYTIFYSLSASNSFISFLFLNINWSQKNEITFNKTDKFNIELQNWIKDINNEKIYKTIIFIFDTHNCFFNSHYFRKEPFHKIDFSFCKNVLKTE